MLRVKTHTANNIYGREFFLVQYYTTFQKIFFGQTQHIALKLEKSAISRVKKTLFAFTKMAKNQFLHQKKV